MFNLKAIDEVETLVKKTLADRTTETADLQDLVTAEAEAIAKANAAMEAATNAGDVVAYQKAKRNRQDALDAKEMHERRLDTLNNKPLISKAEYEKAVAAVFADIAAADDQTKAKLAKLSDEMNAASNELGEAINRANDVLHSLQHKVYRDADRTRHPKTGEFYISHEVKEIVKWNTVNWGKVGIKAYQYTEYTGRKVE